MISRLLPVLCLLPLLSGCFTYTLAPAFDPQFPDNNAASIRQVTQRLPAPSEPTLEATPAVAVMAVGSPPSRLEAVELASGRVLWSTPLRVDTAPILLDGIVMTSTQTAEGSEIVAVSQQDGRVLWRIENETMMFLGADRVGNDIILVSSVGAAGGPTRASYVRLVDASTGAERWSHEGAGIAGRPAAQGPYVFVPWERQSVAILDRKSGDEVARLRSKDDVIHWVRASSAGVFYGGTTYYRLTENAATGRKADGVWINNPVKGAPKAAEIEKDAFLPIPGSRSGRSRIRFYTKPGAPRTDAPVNMVGDVLYYTYYRHVYAFDTDGNLLWAIMLDSAVAGGEVHPEGLLAITDDGTALVLSRASGTKLYEKKLAVDGEVASVAVTGGQLDTDEVDESPVDLRTALNELALDPDNTMVTSRAYAIRQLARLPEEEITRDLIDLYVQKSMPSALRLTLEEAMLERQSGFDYLVRALDQHYDFLEGSQAPPFKLLVPPLVAQQNKDALPGLVRHMLDHETPFDELPLVVDAVVKLGDASVVPTLVEFVQLYHADSTFKAKPAALARASEGIFEHGGPDGRKQLRVWIDQKRTLKKLKASMAKPFSLEAKALATRTKEEEAARQAAAREAAEQEVAERPLKLSQDEINRVFVAELEALRPCIRDELNRNEQLGRVRFTFIIESDGVGRDYTSAPNGNAFVSCVDPILESLQFPKFRMPRQAATFTINLRRNVAIDDGVDNRRNQPWWVRNRSRYIVFTESGDGTATTPWWVLRDAPRDAQATASEEEPVDAWWIPVEEEEIDPEAGDTVEPNG